MPNGYLVIFCLTHAGRNRDLLSNTLLEFQRTNYIHHWFYEFVLPIVSSGKKNTCTFVAVVNTCLMYKAKYLVRLELVGKEKNSTFFFIEYKFFCEHVLRFANQYHLWLFLPLVFNQSLFLPLNIVFYSFPSFRSP